MPRRLRSQLALVIAIAMAPAGLLALLQAFASADDAIGQREAVFASEMRATALKERDALVQVRDALAAAADTAEGEFLINGDCGPALRVLSAGVAGISRAALLDSAGRTVCGTEPWTTGDLPQWDEFKRWPHPMFSLDASAVTDDDADGADDAEAKTGADTGADAQGAAKGAATWRVIALHPTVFRRREAFAVAAEVGLSQLRALSAATDARQVYGVADSRGTLLSDSGGLGSSWLPRDLNALLGSFERAVSTASEQGIRRLYVTQPLIEGQLWAVASIPKATFLDVLASHDGFTILAPVLLWGLAVVVAYVSIDKLVTRHIANLHRATARIGQGDLDVKIRGLDGAPVELIALGDAIREMARNLQDRDADLRDLIDRQKTLILEIHHRVKNNLQMVTSLINIQLRRARAPDEREALRFLEDRIQSLALVHHHLYGSEDMDRIALDELVRDICERLKLSMTPIGASVEFRYQLAHLVVDPRIATPAALFLTEAVSNAFKHAVPSTGKSQIDIALATSGRRFTLEIRNRLNGATAVSEEADRQRLGMRLLRSFAAQLDGSFEKTVTEDEFSLVLSAPIAVRGTEPAPSGHG
jgi:two-component sensor histidine kinase